MNRIINSDCITGLKELPDNSVDSVVTDPPYGLSFMGKAWDYDVPKVEIWRECLRVLKPGGHLLSFFGTRTYHRGVVQIEDAGFEIRDQIGWAYGSGFPKSHNIGKAITALERFGGSAPKNIRRARMNGDYKPTGQVDYKKGRAFSSEIENDAKETELSPGAVKWKKWGTALKPAWEPIVVARKPIEGTVAENVMRWGTGAINIDGCRVQSADGNTTARKPSIVADTAAGFGKGMAMGGNGSALGRWPANLIHDGSEEVVGLFPYSKSTGGKGDKSMGALGKSKYGKYSLDIQGANAGGLGDEGSAARFFYCAKASKADRDNGLDNTCIVKYNIPPGGVLCKDEIMGLVQLLKKATSELTTTWLIGESGESITGLCQSDILSTTLTAISKITTSQTLNLLPPLNTSVPTPDVNCEMENGISHVASVGKLSECIQTTTPESPALAHGVSPAVSQMLSAISAEENWKPLTNFHATVKPTDLMRYLVRLVTPPGGTVLDPFMGSGSTGKAAVLEGFGFIGMEREAEYCQIAEKRISATKEAQLKLF